MAKFRNEDLLLATNQKVWFGDSNERYISFDGTYLTISGGMQVKDGSLRFSTGVAVDRILDEDSMGSNAANALATQQSIKAYIDTQIATISGGGFDHGNLQGLGDDDHTQYLLADGSRQLTGTWNFGSNTISGTGDIHCGKIFGDIEDTNRKTGRDSIADNATSKTIAFASAYPSTNYTIAPTLCNTVDSKPSIYPLVISAKTTGGFTVDFTGKMDSANYRLEWITVLD